ncbi:MAG TPA: DUF4267 domain-containing protein [Bryobacteraceae bacterium]|nr:DUF4267 domain-containing protein [Bryobacteraceae bacterium]
MILQLLALLLLGLMCGSELSVAAFAHPTLNRQPLDTHILVRSSFATLLGRVMPFWMAASTLFNLLLLLPFAHLNPLAWRFSAVALAIQVLAIVFSLVAPVPINNRIARWAPKSLPDDWRAQEHRWDVYHWLRTSGLVAAFALLALSLLAPRNLPPSSVPEAGQLQSGSILFWLVLLIAVGIIFIGARFILSPIRAASDFGVPSDANGRLAYLWAKGTRDVVSGLLAIGLLRLRVSPEVIAVFIFITSLVPLADAVNVYAHVRTRNTIAIFIHGGTALFMWLLGFLLLRA